MIVGLTGGIGSGKTTISNVFGTMGCAIYNSDDKAKEIYFESSVKELVVELLGTNAYINEKEINKQFISEKIFTDNKLLQKLNAIIHPAVKKDFLEFKNSFTPKSIIIKESALLFETGIYKDLDYSILVTAPLELRLERVMKRNSISKQDVEKRMNNQWTDERKLLLADFVIINNNDTPLIPQVISVIEQLTLKL